jgi:hypothetical protein
LDYFLGVYKPPERSLHRYALAMLQAYHVNAHFDCPVQAASVLPMVHLDDLVAGLVALTEADRSSLKEPECGYAMAGFSFAPQDLAAHLASLRGPLHTARSADSEEGSGCRKGEEDENATSTPVVAGAVGGGGGGGRGDAADGGAWGVTYNAASTNGATAAAFANLWPDSLCGAAAHRDLQWRPAQVPTLAAAVGCILAGHATRARLEAAAGVR